MDLTTSNLPHEGASSCSTVTVLTQTAILITFIWIVRRLSASKSTPQAPDGSKHVPIVPGSLPIVGHYLTIYRDPVGFLQKCYAKYGPVFRIQMFRTSTVLVCDRSLLQNHFFKATEETLSAEGFFNTYFREAFFGREMACTPINIITRKALRVPVEVYVLQMETQAKIMVERLQVQKWQGRKIDLNYEMSRYMAALAASVFLNCELSSETMHELIKFIDHANFYIGLKFLLPEWMTQSLFLWRQISVKDRLIRQIEPQVQLCRDNPEDQSPFLRAALEEDSLKMTNQQIAELTVVNFHTIMTNTGASLTNLLIELNSRGNEEILSKVKREVSPFVYNGDMKSLLNSEYLNACVMEIFRLLPNFLTIVREPRGNKMLGDYYLGNADTVSVCQLMTHIHARKEETGFSSSEKFNPGRFTEGGESFGTSSILTFSGGIHTCPGKNFAINAVKVGLAYFLANFEIDMEQSSISPPDLFSFSSFSERRSKVCLKDVR